jgi:hypothetical protein
MNTPIWARLLLLLTDLSPGLMPGPRLYEEKKYMETGDQSESLVNHWVSLQMQTRMCNLQ